MYPNFISWLVVSVRAINLYKKKIVSGRLSDQSTYWFAIVNLNEEFLMPFHTWAAQVNNLGFIMNGR